MKKVLFVATVESHILRFHLPYLKQFKSLGYEVHVACKGNSKIEFCDVKHNINFERFPFKPSNIKAYFALKKIITENNFKIIHCHTPVGGVIGRLAAKGERNKGTNVFYTAHGFHFCKKGPIIDWLIYYPIEKILANITDCLITINEEDFSLAKKKFNANNVFKINGIGVELNKFAQNITYEDKINIKKSENINEKDYIISYVADLSKRKNQGFVISAMPQILKHIPNTKLLLIGPDTANGVYSKMVKELSLCESIYFLGERSDIDKLLSITDISISSSKREGLAVNIIEAQAGGKCVIASNVRGNRDLIEHNKTGFLFSLNNSQEFIKTIIDTYNDNNLKNIVEKNAVLSVQKYSQRQVVNDMFEIYKMVCKNL